MMKPLRPAAMRLSLSSAIGGLVFALAACGVDRSNAPSQVAVRVNGDEVSVHQVDLLLNSRPPALPTAAASAVTRSVLGSLVDQELAAQAARKAGLDRDPRVIQMMEAAKRQVLADYFRERIGARAVDPSSDEIDRYYDEHPELFARRRLFQLQETIVDVRSDRFDALKRTLDATDSTAKLQESIGRERLRSSVRHLSMSAEDLPLSVLPQLAQLKDGESVTLPREGGARVLTLLGSQAAPLNRDVARRLIAQYLVNERKRKLIGESMSALRNDAKVEYVGRYAAAGSANDVSHDLETKR